MAYIIYGRFMPFLIMKKLLITLLGILTMSSSILAAEGWITDYTQGVEEAKKSNKNMMVLFTGSDWCIWCKRLHSEILVKDEFTNFAKDNLILVELDFPAKNKPSQEVQDQRKALAQKYEIRGYPTLVLLTPEEKEFGRMGYMKEGAEAFVQHYKELAQKASSVKPQSGNGCEITLNYKDAPEMEGWMKAMKAICHEWYPQIISILGMEKSSYQNVTITIDAGMNGVAGTGGNQIFLSKDYFSKHGTDAGAIIHELVHVVQAYPKYIPWITEAIADYVRLYHFEPNAPRPQVNPEHAKLQDGYKTGAIFMAWLVENKDKDIVIKLNKALQEGTYQDEIFKEITGKTANELFEEFLTSIQKN